MYKGGTVITGGELRLADEDVTGSSADAYNGTDATQFVEGTGHILTAQTTLLDTAFNADATCDIQGGRLVLEHDQATNANAYISNIVGILTAAHDSSWASGRISSSTAAADPTTTHALGWIEDTTNSLVTIALTLYGDANLDGVVDNADLALMTSSWLANGVWAQGDYDYNGFIGTSDLDLMAVNWQAPAGSSQTFAEACIEAGVPEPGTLALLVGAVLGLSLRSVRNRARSWE